MNRRHYLLTVALSLATVLTGHALYGWLAAPTAAHAAAEPRRDSQYEYSAVVKSQSVPTPRLFYWIVYFRDDGTTRIDPIEATLGGNSQAKAIAKLGADGWEMVGEGQLDIRPGTAATALFFKRRKE